MAPAVQGDQIGGCTPRRRTWRSRARRTARTHAGVTRMARASSACHAHCRRRRATKGLGDIAAWRAAHPRPARRPDDRARTGKPPRAAMSVVTPWLMAEPQRLRADAWRLPARQHACSIPIARASRSSTGRRWASACPPATWRTSRQPAWLPGHAGRQSNDDLVGRLPRGARRLRRDRLRRRHLLA